MPTHRLLLLALIATTILLPACKKAQDAAVEAAVERATGAKVDKDGNTVTVKTDKGEMRITTAADGEAVALPAGFPSDLYLPAPHKVDSVMAMGSAHMVNLTTPMATADVHAGVVAAMQRGGWTQELAMQTGEGSTLAYRKDKRQAFYQLVKQDGGGTQLAIRAGNDE